VAVPQSGVRWPLGDPFWRSTRMEGESLFFLRPDDRTAPRARLLLPPVAPVALVGPSCGVVYEEGRDYVVDAATGVVSLTAGSAVPFTDAGELYRPLDAPCTIPHKAGAPTTGLYWREGSAFAGLQVEASYDHRSTWDGYRPSFQGDRLPRTAERLRSGAPLALAVIGDSISAGANASGHTGARPFMPPYPDLVAGELERRFGGSVTLTNHAVAGKRVAHGLEVVDAVIAGRPDLVIVAYGMNDAGATPAGAYEATVREILDRIRAGAPQAEFILVAPMLGNPQWNATPTDALFAFRDALGALGADGIVLADLTQLWADLLAVKTYHDLTGNGVNHPNDFGHRLYAQVLLALLT